jgi:acyl carrier protein
MGGGLLTMDTRSRVKAVLVKTLVIDPDHVKDGALLVEDLGVSSLDRFEIIIDLEQEFGLEIEEGDLGGTRTVSDVVRCIEGLIKPA